MTRTLGFWGVFGGRLLLHVLVIAAASVMIEWFVVACVPHYRFNGGLAFVVTACFASLLVQFPYSRWLSSTWLYPTEAFCVAGFLMVCLGAASLLVLRVWPRSELLVGLGWACFIANSVVGLVRVWRMR
ncbi:MULTISPECIES: hypothetical protein [Dyella]|uniref:Uncharacterized protein n=2 Tax=Dyella TaxID=231454 RepID=A0A4R0Z151_9GAMM|nr:MULTISPECIES: hypothetical protein [Dyella]TBR39067.1 hypothetical protein EYV96_02150 [Dyella terrae]TCI13344.1 hypothetical protein EZM97_08720 [Dyella soli]